MQRRKFIQVAAAGTAQLALSGLLPRKLWAGTPSRGQRVAILGGGVGGMSAAHELMERGFDVSVYELKSIAGGKARSIAVPGSGKDGRGDLPGEHGFRFFPGFYRHLPDTMKRIPYAGQTNGVFDNLTASTRLEIARAGEAPMILPTQLPKSTADFDFALQVLSEHGPGISNEERLFFLRKLERFLTSCDERRLAEYESMTWWDYVEAGSHSAAYQKYFAIGLTRSLVAARAETMSARTGGAIFTQLLLSMLGQGATVDRVLNGPTSDVWIGPWLDYLTRNGVDYHLGASVQSLQMDSGLISGATVLENGVLNQIDADYYILAVPVEVVVKLLTPEIIAADPALARLSRLKTEWMNGIQFYLREDVPICHGHCLFIDSPWALTAISQPQFWRNYDLSRRGGGDVRGIISVDISNWQKPGILFGKPAQECTKEEVFQEVWAQLGQHLQGQGIQLREEALVTWFLDPGITFPAPGKVENAEPLLVNTANSWWDRPEAARPIANLFLAADYVRTYTDLASMEAANEAARRAVNGILSASGSSATACELWPFQEPAIFAPAKALDGIAYRASTSATVSSTQTG